MRLLRFYTHGLTAYVVLGPVLNKSLEIGGGKAHAVGRRLSAHRLDISVSFRTTGDHAGIRASVSWLGAMFEVNLTDTRHWDWVKGRFATRGDET